MANSSISLPDSVRDLMEEQMAEGGYATPGDYLAHLIQDAQARGAAGDYLERLLLEGLDSGPPIEVTPEYWQGKQADFVRRHQGSKPLLRGHLGICPGGGLGAN